MGRSNHRETLASSQNGESEILSIPAAMSHLRWENILCRVTDDLLHRPLYPNLLRLRLSRFQKSENDQTAL